MEIKKIDAAAVEYLIPSSPVASVTRGDSNAWAINVPPTRKFEGRANYSEIRVIGIL